MPNSKPSCSRQDVLTIHNRVRALMLHVPWYSIEGQCRLAHDCGVSCSTISRLVRGKSRPSYNLAQSVTSAMAKRLGVPVDMRDLFSTDGTYPTSCVCDLTPFCRGCFPPEAYDDDCNLRPEYRNLQPGDWCRFPPLIWPHASEGNPSSSVTTNL